jgi:hypothetical protein
VLVLRRQATTGAFVSTKGILPARDDKGGLMRPCAPAVGQLLSTERTLQSGVRRRAAIGSVWCSRRRWPPGRGWLRAAAA